MPDPHYAFLPATDDEGEFACLVVAFKPGAENQARAYAVCGVHGADDDDECDICWMASEVRTRYLLETVRKAHDAYGESGYMAGWKN